MNKYARARAHTHFHTHAHTLYLLTQYTHAHARTQMHVHIHIYTYRVPLVLVFTFQYYPASCPCASAMRLFSLRVTPEQLAVGGRRASLPMASAALGSPPVPSPSLAGQGRALDRDSLDLSPASRPSARSKALHQDDFGRDSTHRTVPWPLGP